MKTTLHVHYYCTEYIVAPISMLIQVKCIEMHESSAYFELIVNCLLCDKI
jgi:hypothetical protein